MENFENENNEKKDRQIDNLVHLVENHTRTERHLEQYSHIGDKDNKDNAREKQKIREEEIENLKGKIIEGEKIQGKQEQIENLQNRYENTKHYIENNMENMTDEALKNVQEKQFNRKEQLDNLQNE